MEIIENPILTYEMFEFACANAEIKKDILKILAYNLELIRQDILYKIFGLFFIGFVYLFVPNSNIGILVLCKYLISASSICFVGIDLIFGYSLASVISFFYKVNLLDDEIIKICWNYWKAHH